MGLVVTFLSALGIVSALVSPVWGACAFVAALVIRPNEHVEGVLFPVVPAMIVVTAIGFLLHFRQQLPRQMGARQRSAVLMVLMLLLLLVHLLVWHRERMVDYILGEAAPIVLLMLFVTRYMSSAPRLSALFGTLGASSAIIGTQAFLIHFFFKQPPFKTKNQFGDTVISYGALWDSYHLEGTRLMGRSTGTWGNSNDLGMVCNWGLPVSLYYLKRRGSKLLKTIAAAISLLLMGTIFLTGSRGSQLQLGTNLWLVFMGGRRKVLGGFLLVLALVGVMVLLPRLAPERVDAGASKDERTWLLQDALRMFVHNPILGVGFGNFPDLAFKTLMPHNVYAQCLAETGLLGAAIFFPLIFYLRRETSRAVKHCEATADPNTAVLARCISTLQFSFLIFMLFSNQFMRFTFGIAVVGGMALYVMLLREQQAAAETKAAADVAPAANAAPPSAPTAPAATRDPSVRLAVRSAPKLPPRGGSR